MAAEWMTPRLFVEILDAKVVETSELVGEFEGESLTSGTSFCEIPLSRA